MKDQTMPYSPRLPVPGTPQRNHVVDQVASHLRGIGRTFANVAAEIEGRHVLTPEDVAETTARLDRIGPTLGQIGAELSSPDSGLRVHGATNEHPAVSGGVRS